MTAAATALVKAGGFNSTLTPRLSKNPSFSATTVSRSVGTPWVTPILMTEPSAEAASLPHAPKVNAATVVAAMNIVFDVRKLCVFN